MRLTALAIVAAVLAGCSQNGPTATPAPIGIEVAGWVMDAALKPIAGASITAADGQAITDAAGHFSLLAPSGQNLVLVAAAPGYAASSKAIPAFSGATHIINFTLERLPDMAPYHEIQAFTGFLQCAVTAVVMEDQSRPHEHRGVRCSATVNDTRNVWHTSIDPLATGLIIEAKWMPNNAASQGLVMKATVDGSGEVLGFLEGPSMLHLQVSQARLRQSIEAGFLDYTVVVDAGAGTGEHEHGAVGVFVEQPFELYATTFYNGPVDPAYSVADIG